MDFCTLFFVLTVKKRVEIQSLTLSDRRSERWIFGLTEGKGIV
jgi:hypothetical protein